MSESVATIKKAPEVSRNLFGGVLVYDGAGHYPGLELLNFVFGTETGRLLADEDPIRIRRRSHDFARKLVWDEEGFSDDPRKESVVFNDDSEIALRRLLECLQLEIPNLKKRPSWERAHFFPYTRSLIHWDARRRAQGVGIERRYLRGGGALAFHVLRKDADSERRERIENGLRNLYGLTESGALEQLASVLLEQGYQDAEVQADDIEPQSEIFDDGLEELYVSGTENILGHTELPSVIRIRSLLSWTAFWLVTVQHFRAARYLGQEESFLICDCGSQYPQLRRASQRCLKEKQALILEAVDAEVSQLEGTLPDKQRNSIRGFFWASAATIGLLNAWRGRRHFTLGIGMIESLVLASTPKDSELTFEKFLHEELFHKFRLVVGRASAEEAGLVSSIDASVFEDNENHLSVQMSAAGFLTEYSDATRMVGAGGIQS